MKLETYWKAFFLVVLCLFVAAVLVITQGCASHEHKRQRIQEEHPDCYVMEDLTLECPNPFIDSSAGFGVEVHNQKIKPTKGKRK